jgi:pimeloyl-ACP methyl ester carboxylesterase
MTLSGPTSNSFISQRLKLHYADWGNSDAPPLLLIHGGRDHCRSWDWVAEELRQDWHVIAPDLRGHGDSAWSPDGNYEMAPFVYDLAQLIHQLDLGPVTIVAHSMGGNIAIRYTGLYPTLEDALDRMKAENTYLSDEQARHLTVHGISRNEDGSWTWKFDNYLNIWSAFDMPQSDLHAIWGAITCPVLLLYGANSWASNPETDGRLDHFKTASVIEFENAGHWLHHDQFERFTSELKAFL